MDKMPESNKPPPKISDLESGVRAKPLYPSMVESPELRWAFVRKIYSILSIQILLTIAVSAVVIFVKPISHFFVSSTAGFALYIVLLISPFIVMVPLYCMYQRHPINLLLLSLFTILISFAVGLSCAFTKGKIILEAAIFTATIVVSLTLYTFWAAKRGHDFTFLGPFLFASLTILILLGIMQILFPMGSILHKIYGGLGALVFSGYIVYDTNNLIKRYGYDEYVWAAVALYLDVVNLFLSLLTLFRGPNV